MNYFVSYRFTGEDPKQLMFVLSEVCNTLRSVGHKVFCSLDEEPQFRKEGWTADLIYEHCLFALEKTDGLLCLVRTTDKSTGIEKEVRKAAELGKPIVLAVHRDVPDTFLQEAYKITRTSCHKYIEYDDVEHLCSVLRTL